MTAAHRYIVRVIALGIVVQFFLAGAGAFGATSFDAHKVLGTVLIGVTLLQGVFGTLGSDTLAWFGGVPALRGRGRQQTPPLDSGAQTVNITHDD